MEMLLDLHLRFTLFVTEKVYPIMCPDPTFGTVLRCARRVSFTVELLTFVIVTPIVIVSIFVVGWTILKTLSFFRR